MANGKPVQSDGAVTVSSEHGQAPLTVALFDLDGTLYPTSNGYVQHVRAQLFRYMEDKLGIADPEVAWKPLFAQYNQTLRGLICSGHDIDKQEYWATTRAGADQFMTAAPQGLKDLLKSLPQKKHIFTNCNETEAHDVLKLLQLNQHFDGVFGSTFMGDACKPESAAFEKVLEVLNVKGSQVAFFEDSFKNLVTGRHLGMTTVLIDSLTTHEEGVTAEHMASVDAVVLDHELTLEVMQRKLPQLWHRQS